MFKRWFWSSFFAVLATFTSIMSLRWALDVFEYGSILYSSKYTDYQTRIDYEQLASTILSVFLMCFSAGIVAYIIRKMFQFAKNDK